MQLNRRLALVINTFLFVGCARSPDLPDLFRRADYADPPGRELAYASAAPIVVEGTVTKARAVGKPHAAREDSRLLIQLTQISLQTEIAIKGTIKSKELNFYYYTFATGNRQDLGIYHYLPVIGQRRIFFLEQSHGVYRSVGDVTDYTLAVRSGAHNPSTCQGESPGCCISKLLLLPGQGYDGKSFAQGLPNAAHASELLCSRAVTRQLLGQLSNAPDEMIASRARDLLKVENDSR